MAVCPEGRSHSRQSFYERRQLRATDFQARGVSGHSKRARPPNRFCCRVSALISIEELRKLFPGASESTIRRNLEQAEAARLNKPEVLMAGGVVDSVGTVQHLSVSAQPVVVPAPGHLKLNVSTDEANLNKNEASYLAWLRTQGDLWIGIQNITLKFGHDLRYTPDFFAFDANGMRAIDCKGVKKDGTLLYYDDAKVKIKACARLFPMFRFLIAYKHRNAALWHHMEVKP